LLVGCRGSNPGIEVDASATASCVWSAPVELTEFSDAATEREPTETGDRLELYYTADDTTGEIVFASRASVDAPFVRQALPSFDDPVATESSPVISADGLHLVFTSDRGGTLDVYESIRSTRETSWSMPVPVLANVPGPLGSDGIGMTTDALYVVAHVMDSPGQELAYCFTRQQLDQPFWGNCDELYSIPSPAFDDLASTIYYNCGAGICARPLTTWPSFKTPGAEQHVAMGTESGAADPWVEPGGDTILFAADHSLFRTTRSCN
jgi:hypothetical protein